ncbi:hypothetical protein SNEBB_002225 [Seison nebaliae]|nr:hypothetical protein SNEBB_002225 [Seison nebaliae]
MIVLLISFLIVLQSTLVKLDNSTEAKFEPTQDKPCIFPFPYNGRCYSECTYDGYDEKIHTWCAIEVPLVSGTAFWRLCQGKDHGITPKSDVPKCFFPFLYQGRCYNECIQLPGEKTTWCSAKPVYQSVRDRQPCIESSAKHYPFNFHQMIFCLLLLYFSGK